MSIAIDNAMDVRTATRTNGSMFRIQGGMRRQTAKAVCLTVANVYEADKYTTPFAALLGETMWFPLSQARNIEYIDADEFRADFPSWLLTAKCA